MINQQAAENGKAKTREMFKKGHQQKTKNQNKTKQNKTKKKERERESTKTTKI